MNRIIVALFRPGKRLPRSPGPAGTEQQPRLFVRSQPLLPFLGGCPGHPKSAWPCPCALCRLFVASSLPSAGCWRVPRSWVPWVPYPRISAPLEPCLQIPPVQGEHGQWMRVGGTGGRNAPGGAGRSPRKAWWGLAPMAPLFWLFLPPCPVPPAVSAPWLTQTRVHSGDGEELETNLASCRSLFAQLPCWLLPAQLLGVIRQLQLAPRTARFRAARGSLEHRQRGCGTGPAPAALCWQRPRGVRRSHCLCRTPRAEEALPGFLPTHPAVRGTRRRPCLTPCAPGSLREPLRASGTCPGTRLPEPPLAPP